MRMAVSTNLLARWQDQFSVTQIDPDQPTAQSGVMSLRTLLACSAIIMASSTASAAEQPDYFGAAMCKPPYSYKLANGLYHAAEKLGKPDMSTMGAAIYHLPTPIGKDGFVTQNLAFAGSSVGVLIEGHVAAQLAERYHLRRESSSLLGASSLGFSRTLPDDQQDQKDAGLVSLVAREGPSLGGRTLLACEFDSRENLEALKALDRITSASRNNSDDQPRQ